MKTERSFKTRAISALLMVMLCAGSAEAHHGKEFFLTATSRTPERGDLRNPGNSSLTPGLYVGLGSGVQARLGASFAQTAGTPQTTVRLSFVSEF